MSSENPTTFLHQIRDLYATYINQKKKFRWLAVFASVCTLISLGVLSEYFLFLSALAKSVLISANLVLVFLIAFFLRKIFQTRTLRSFLHYLVSQNPNLSPVLNFWELSQEENNVDRPFKALALDELAYEMNEKDIISLLKATIAEKKNESHIVALNVLSAASVIFLISTIFFTGNALPRFAHFWESYQPINPFAFSVSPADTTIELGALFSPSITFIGDQPKNVRLLLKSEQESDFRKYSLEKKGEKALVGKELLINSDFSYQFEMDGFTSNIYRVNVEILPRFEQLVVHINPPAYSQIPADSLSYPYSEIEVLKGSTIQFKSRGNKRLQFAELRSKNFSESLKSADSLANTWESSRFSVVESDSFYFDMNDFSGLTNRNRFTSVISVFPDDSLQISIVSPGISSEIFGSDTTLINVLAFDDFGIRSLTANYTITKAFETKKTVKTERLSVSRSTKQIAVQLPFYAEKFGLEPFDEVEIFVHGYDNDTVSGPKKTVSNKITIRIGSTADMLLSSEMKEKNIEDSFSETKEQMDRIKSEFEDFKDILKSDERQLWEADENFKQIDEAYSEIEKKIEELNDEFGDLKQELSKQNLISEETQQKYEELQQIIDELNDPALKEALEKLQEGLQNMDQNMLKNAMENFQFSEESYRKRLERTLELFKSIQTMAELDKADKLLEELQKREEALQNIDASDSTKFNKEQEKIKEELNLLDKTREQISEKAPEKLQEMVEELNQQISQDKEDIQQQIDEAIQEMKQPNGKSSPPSTQDIQKSMQQLRNKIKAAQESMSSEQKSINLAALKSALFNLLLISESEEDISRTVSNLAFQSPEFANQARLQSNLVTHFNRVADTLNSVAKVLPPFSSKTIEQQNKVNQLVQRSLNHLAERDKNNASAELRFTLGEINTLATMLADLIEQVENQDPNGNGSGSGMSSEQFMESLQQMGEQQQQMNQQLQQMINDMAGNRLSQSQMERLQQMAKTQNQLRKQLEELKKNGGLKPGDKILSELQRMTEMMEQSINELRGGSIDRTLINRQQNILSRMLEVEKAMDQRDEDDKREGKTPEEIQRKSPPELQLEELKKILEQQLLDKNLTRYSTDYQRLIELYFELLQQQNNPAGS